MLVMIIDVSTLQLLSSMMVKLYVPAIKFEMAALSSLSPTPSLSQSNI